MPIQYTGPLRAVMTVDLEERLHKSLAEFPELTDKGIKVGLTKSADGTAEAENMVIRLNVRRRKPVSYFTIGHELTHLLQNGGLGVVPSGEIQCDVWTLARSDLFLDDQPTYLCPHLWTRPNWPHHALNVRALCIRAIEVRKTSRRYLVWLSRALESHALSLRSGEPRGTLPADAPNEHLSPTRRMSADEADLVAISEAK